MQYLARIGFVLLTTFLMARTTVAQDAVQWRVEDGGNGHWYAVIEELSLWTESVEHARDLGGELASINSTEENTQVRDLVIDAKLWCGADGVWLGGQKPAEDWVWIDGSPWNFTGWCPNGDGNDSEEDPDARYLQWNRYSGDPCWDDHRNTGCWAGEQGNLGYVIEWAADCNGDGIVDYGQILDGSLGDLNNDGIPDVCNFNVGDFNLDGCIDGSDLATLLALWGFSNPPVGDLNGDGTIDGQDLATFLANWEPCP